METVVRGAQSPPAEDEVAMEGSAATAGPVELVAERRAHPARTAGMVPEGGRGAKAGEGGEGGGGIDGAAGGDGGSGGNGFGGGVYLAAGSMTIQSVTVTSARRRGGRAGKAVMEVLVAMESQADPARLVETGVAAALVEAAERTLQHGNGGKGGNGAAGGSGGTGGTHGPGGDGGNGADGGNGGDGGAGQGGGIFVAGGQLNLGSSTLSSDAATGGTGGAGGAGGGKGGREIRRSRRFHDRRPWRRGS